MITLKDLKGKTHIKEGFSSSRFPDAKQRRDRMARELRKAGFKVTVKTWNFIDLSRNMYYTLEAEKLDLT